MKNFRIKITAILSLMVAVLFTSCTTENIEPQITFKKEINVENTQVLDNQVILEKLNKDLTNFLSANEEINAQVNGLDVNTARLNTYSHSNQQSITISMDNGMTYVRYAEDGELLDGGMFMITEAIDEVTLVTYYSTDLEIIGGLFLKGESFRTHGIANTMFPNGLSADDVQCAITTAECGAGLVIAPAN